MKNLLLITIILLLFSGINSCVDNFLEKPDTSGTVELDQIFSNSLNAEAALFYCYRNVLKHGWPTGIGLSHGSLANISGELARGYDWHSTYTINNIGLGPTGAQPSNESSGTAGADCMPQTWEYIRACFIVKENIHKATDMDETMKDYIRGEATGLIAYRYMGMFYRYGGVPIVEKSFLPSEDLNIPRASLEQTLEYIIELCDEAYDKLPDSWAGIEGGKNIGRLTKGVALAMKARTLMYAARPLFNSSTPYLPLSGHEDLICFGNADPTRWQDAIAANEAVLSWATTNGYKLINTGGAGEGNPNPNAAHDYGTACSEMNNQEVILAYKFDTGSDNWLARSYNNSPYWTSFRFDTDLTGMLGNFLESYYDKNGNDINWPKVGDASERPISDWIEKIENIEPRFKMDVLAPGMNGLANPDDNNWQPDGWGRPLSNYETGGAGATSSNAFPNSTDMGYGCGYSTKYYYKAGPRVWFEPPLFRLAETYLNLAEAYNEANDPTNALKNLNMVRNRAGLPVITVTDKEQLQKIIWREKAIEFFNENHRYYDVKHWKHPDIGTEIIGGQRRELQFLRTTSGNIMSVFVSYWMANTYVSFWHPKMFLEPFHQNEINKGITIQNPGY